MINFIAVNGFRSLRSFELQIKPGLNVLVGPNGAGKTNIILFFELLRLAFSEGVSNAVGKLGGVGGVFQKRGRKTFAPRIDFTVKGAGEVDETAFNYEVSASIAVLESTQEIAFCRQRIVVEQVNGPVLLGVDWSLSGDSDMPPNVQFEGTETLQERAFFRSPDDAIRFLRGKWSRDASILTMLQHSSPTIDVVLFDLSSRFLLNVVPTAVKGLEDSARTPGIDSNGSGLSATLYAIKRNLPIPDVRPKVRRIRHAKTGAQWSRIVSQIRVAVPSIEDIEIENDPFDNRLRVRVVIGKGNRRAVLPLSSLSDGTVKWMSLVVRLATSKAALLLEEPENYLHPLMQQEVVRMLRDSVAEDGFVILSTHSETLLNVVRSEELVVVSYAGGSTRARRVSNSTELNEEISKTGFGLGYYYLADAIRDHV